MENRITSPRLVNITWPTFILNVAAAVEEQFADRTKNLEDEKHSNRALFPLVKRILQY